MAEATLEADLYRRSLNDGLMDLLGGAALLSVGLGWMFNAAAAGAVAPAILISLWPLLRRRLTAPRMGDVEFSSARQALINAGLQRIAIAFTASFILGVGAYFLFESRDGLPEALVMRAILATPGLIVAAIAILVSLLTGLFRFAIYGAILAAAALWLQLGLEAGPGYDLTVGAIAPLVYGTLLFARFLRENPISRD